MLLKTNPHLDSALRNLKMNDDFRKVVEWLKESREDINKSLIVGRDEVNTRWMQGAVQVLDDMIGRM